MFGEISTRSMSKRARRKPRTVLIADDVPVVRLGVRRLIEAEPELELVGEAQDGLETLDMVRKFRPDLLLLDLEMPKLSGLEVMAKLGPDFEETRIAVLTGSAESKEVLKSFELGARGVIAKDVSPQEILEGIRAVFDGQYWLAGRSIPNLVATLEQLREDAARPFKKFGLTPREAEIVAEIVKGMTNRELADKLNISEDTIKRHLSNIFDKVGASHRLELVLFAFHHKLVDKFIGFNRYQPSTTLVVGRHPSWNIQALPSFYPFSGERKPVSSWGRHLVRADTEASMNLRVHPTWKIIASAESGAVRVIATTGSIQSTMSPISLARAWGTFASTAAGLHRRWMRRTGTHVVLARARDIHPLKPRHLPTEEPSIDIGATVTNQCTQQTSPGRLVRRLEHVVKAESTPIHSSIN